MKKKFGLLSLPVVFLLALALLLPLSAQADLPDDQCPSPFSSDGHHTWDIRDKKDATCTDDGYQIWQCTDCGKEYTETISVSEHVWDNGAVTTPATCTAEGVKTFTCMRCGATRTEAIPATGHSQDTDIIPAVAATCTTDGKTEGTQCKICGTVLTAPQNIPALGHDWDGGTVTTAPTCTAEGVKTFTCTRCGATSTEAIAATGHSPVGIPAEAATCTSGGKTEGSVCSVCGTVLTAQQDIPALGHSWDSGTMTTPPTCTEAGVKTYTCTRCGATSAESIPAAGHSPVSIPAEPASCTSGGKTEGSVCSVCGAVLTAQQDIPALGHSWDGGTVIREAGYLETGLKTYTCTRCGETKTEEIPVNMPMSGGSIMDLFRNIPPDAVSSDPLRIVTQPVGGSIDHEDDYMILMVEAEGGNPPYTYQWRMRYNGWWGMWHDVEDGTESALEARKGPYLYYCNVYDSKNDHVASEKVVVGWDLYIAEQPKNTNLSMKDSAILKCRAAGGEPFENGSYIYAWYNSAGEQISYSNEGTAEVTEPGEYYCMVQDSGEGLETSKTVTVYEADPFEAITDAPVVRLKEGEEYELRAEVYGGVAPYTGVWMRNGEEIPTQQGDGGIFTAPILGDGSKETVYTFAAADAMENTAACTVKVRYLQLSTARQPQSGMLSDEKKYTLGIVMAEGEEPFTFTLYRNGEKAKSYFDQRNFFYHDVTEAGEYYYHVEDAAGRWADSITVTVQGPAFRIDYIYVAGPIKYASGTRLKAVTKNGVKPIRYSWWFIDPIDGHAEPMAYGDTATDTFYAHYEGTYLCYAEDAEKNYDRMQVQVISDSKAPVITWQPEIGSVYIVAGTDHYSYTFSCNAAAFDGTTDTLEYRWEQRNYNDAYGWVDVHSTGRNTYTWEGDVSNHIHGGTFRCVVTDTRNGQQTISEPAFVRIIDP